MASGTLKLSFTLCWVVMIMLRMLSLLCFLSVSVSANPADIPVTENLLGVERYPNAEIVCYDDGKRVNYPLVGQLIKKVNGVVRADEEWRRDGQWTRVIYLLPNGHSSDAGFQHFSDGLRQLDVETIFSCNNRHCGSSNIWANKVFEEANLYGMDKSQFYSLSERKFDNKTEYYVLYAVKRGNRRVYVMMDRLVVNAPLKRSAKVTYDKLPPSAEKLSVHSVDVVIKNASDSILPQDIDKVIALLKNDSSVQLLLAGASSRVSDIPVDQQLEMSHQMANKLKGLLIAHGIPEGRLFVIGTGPLLQSESAKGMPFVRVLALK